jgi:hypothetical protein
VGLTRSAAWASACSRGRQQKQAAAAIRARRRGACCAACSPSLQLRRPGRRRWHPTRRITAERAGTALAESFVLRAALLSPSGATHAAHAAVCARPRASAASGAGAASALQRCKPARQRGHRRCASPQAALDGSWAQCGGAGSWQGIDAGQPHGRYMFTLVTGARLKPVSCRELPTAQCVQRGDAADIRQHGQAEPQPNEGPL